MQYLLCLTICVLAFSVVPVATSSESMTGQTVRGDCNKCPEMVRIPAGSFQMGSPEDEADRNSDEGPQHQVSIISFEIGKYEVTWEEWDACVSAGGCDNSSPESAGGDLGMGKGNRPVSNVTWSDAQSYAKWLSAKTGMKYRLPTEAEWEYAARAGTVTRYSWGNEEPVCEKRAKNGAKFSYCFDDGPAPVGSFTANPFGLHDMHGNVAEWLEDCWHQNYEEAPADGSAWMGDNNGNCKQAVLRGGAWYDAPGDLRSASRIGKTRGHQYVGIGFRVARSL